MEIQVVADHSKDPDIMVILPDQRIYHSLKVRQLVKSKATETVNFLQKFHPEYRATRHSHGDMVVDFYNTENHTHSVVPVEFSTITKGPKVRLKFSGEIEILYWTSFYFTF